MRTRRAFKAFLAWDAEEGKVNFEFAPSKFPPRKPLRARPRVPPGSPRPKRPPQRKRQQPKRPCRQKSRRAQKAACHRRRPEAQRRTGRRDRQPTTWPAPKSSRSCGTTSRPTACRTPANKRAINADAKLKPVFGKDQVTMFELAGIVGKHLT
jgi:DNA topoisomerase-3